MKQAQAQALAKLQGKMIGMHPTSIAQKLGLPPNWLQQLQARQAQAEKDLQEIQLRPQQPSYRAKPVKQLRADIRKRLEVIRRKADPVRVAVAHHEAAHAVANVLCGVTLGCCTIKPYGTTIGSTFALKSDIDTTPAVDVISILLAGTYAESKHLCGELSILETAVDDIRRIDERLEKYGQPSRETRLQSSTYRQGSEQARRIVTAHWPTIQRIADALLEKESLTETEVKGLMK